MFECQPDITVHHRGGYGETTHTDVHTHAHTHTHTLFSLSVCLRLSFSLFSPYLNTHTPKLILFLISFSLHPGVSERSTSQRLFDVPKIIIVSAKHTRVVWREATNMRGDTMASHICISDTTSNLSLFLRRSKTVVSA